MDEITQIASQATQNYFDIVTKIGYVNDKDTAKYVLLLIIQDFLEEFQGYISNNDYDILYQLLTCLGQSNCFIPQFSCKYNAEVVGTSMMDTGFRITEWEDLRDTQQTFDLRLINKL